MTYAELIQAMQDWVESSESSLVANLDQMIEFAEKRIYRSIDLDNGFTYNTQAMTIGNHLVALPTDAVVVKSVQLINGTTRIYLEQKDQSFMDDYTGDRSITGTPRYYAHYDDAQLMLAPTPDSTDTLEFAHTYRPTQLSGSQTTTWLSLEAPDVLLYACLKELAAYLKEEPDIIANYDKMYQEAFQGCLLEENFRNRMDSYRDGEIKVNL